MLKSPSVQTDYTIVFSGDPALNLPADEEARAQALKVARETGNWKALTFEGEKPTMFQMRQLPSGTVAWFYGENARRSLTDIEQYILLVRLALRGIDNLPGHPNLNRVERVDGQVLLARAVIDELTLFVTDGPVGQLTLPVELGMAVYDRVIATTQGSPPPKS